jgi:hypothetical protein
MQRTINRPCHSQNPPAKSRPPRSNRGQQQKSIRDVGEISISANDDATCVEGGDTDESAVVAVSIDSFVVSTAWMLVVVASSSSVDNVRVSIPVPSGFASVFGLLIALSLFYFCERDAKSEDAYLVCNTDAPAKAC